MSSAAAIAAAVFLTAPYPAHAQVPPTYLEPYRPQFHFTPAEHWMNDPNGLVSYQGEHHLFYQYNPFGDVWGFDISWGHAVSTDMVHWQELPVAIPATDTVAIFSGSAVVDTNNTSGFGTPTNPPLVAIYTTQYRIDSVDPNNGSFIPQATQAQNIAFSTDNGRTWTPYAGNPVINPHSDPSVVPTEFRDPKVFWHAPTQRWVMALALSRQRQIRFYASTDLKNWTYLSDFGPANGVNGAWECPDLFELPVEGAPRGTKKWVLIVSINPGGAAGGSAGQYFVGNFDGTRFTADSTIDPSTPPPGVLFQNFEGTSTFSGLAWTATGAFVDQGPVGWGGPTGYLGSQYVDTFFGGDPSEGTAQSPTFKINSKYINLLVGGGNHPHDPRTEAPQPAGVLAFSGADVEPPAPGSTTYQQLGWTATGDLVNQPVATGAIGGQQAVTRFQGTGLINTFANASDQPQGTLASPVFTISKPFINFLIGGGNHPYPGNNDATAVVLRVNGQVVNSATGQENETLNWASFDVSQYIGQQAQIEIVDQNPGGWGHINVDQFLAADSAAVPLSTETAVNLLVGGKVVKSATGQNSGHLVWNAWNVAEFAGQDAQIEIVDKNNGGWGHFLVDDIYFSNVPKGQANWIDHGRDFYAVSSWSNLPDNKRRWIAWMNNWDYANVIPTVPWRSAQTIPRDVGLTLLDGKVQLKQTPIPELLQLRQGSAYRRTGSIPAGTTALPNMGKAFEIVAEFQVSTASEFGFKVRTGPGEETLVGYSVPAGEIFLDRTKSGDVSFSNLFPSRETVPLPAPNGRVKLRIFVDWSSVEIFGGNGTASLTDQIFPNPASEGLALFAKGGNARLVSLQIWPLRSIWNGQ